MKTKLMISTFTFLSVLGCSNAQEKELVSVSYSRSGMSIDDSFSIKVQKTAESYTVKLEKGRYVENGGTIFEITKADFDSLSAIVFKMNKPGRVKYLIYDLSEWFDVTFTKKGKTVKRSYSIEQRMNEKTMTLKSQAIELMGHWIYNYNKQFEIRVSYSKGIDTPTEIYTHVEPCDLLEYVGEFVDAGRRNSTYLWKALKPGKVLVWVNELSSNDSTFHEKYEPYGCYIIDENLKVTYSKEGTEAAKQKYKEEK